jgi:hypothetical protein
MTPSLPLRKRLAIVIGPCVLSLLLVPLGQHAVFASPELTPPTRPAAVNLRLDGARATRVLADLSGAAQEDDPDKPRSMEEQANAPSRKAAPGTSAAVKKEAPPPDSFAFVKDWPFWVIVGGVLVAGVAGFVLLRNSNQDGPCAPQFNAGCFGDR